jgi:type I restriction enzyme S subunit
MIANLQPYPDYKESGLPWLGKIPRHWNSGPGFAAFREKQVKNTGMQEKTVLSLSYGRIVVKPPEKLHGLVPDSFETYQIVDPGDIIIRSTDLQNDWNSLRVGLVRNRGIITSAYLCFRTTGTLNPEYGYQLLLAFDLMKVFYGLGSGLRQNLDWGDFKRMLIFIPPPEEQAAMVRFLDYANGRLERAIRAKRKVIALLHEQKQAIIHRAVTRGLPRRSDSEGGPDPTVPLKPSGIPWLGDIPKHWETSRIKYLLREVDHRSTSGSEPLLSMRRNHGLVLFAEHFTRPPQAATLVGFKIVHPGQFVVNRMQAGNGVIFASTLTGLVSPDYAVFDPIGDANVEFLGELFRSRKVRAKFRAESKGLGTGSSGFLRLYNDRLGAIHVPLPPRDEQSAILRGLAKELSSVNTAVTRLEREIELLREYRTRLVADVVTGKLDVRPAASQLSAEPIEPEAAPEIDELSDDTEVEETANVTEQ